MNTTFGTSIFEPAAETLASIRFQFAQKQFSVGNSIAEEAQKEIQKIMNDLSFGKSPDKKEEIERIRKVSQVGSINKLRTVKVDICVKEENGSIHFLI